jgi:HAMP domain-containing protein
MKSKKRFGIVGRIMSGYLAIFILALLVISFSLFTLWNNRGIDKKMTSLYYPTLLLLKDVLSFTDVTYTLSNNWIYQPSPSEKARLISLHESDFQVLTNKINQLNRTLTNEPEKQMLFNLQSDLIKFVDEQKVIMSFLKTEEAYANDSIVDLAISNFNQKIVPIHKQIKVNLEKAVKTENEKVALATESKSNSYYILNTALVISLLLITCIIIGASWYAIQTIQKPVKELSNQVKELALGKYVEINENTERSDEIGEMARAISDMVDGVKLKVDFASKIGKGEYDTYFKLLSNDDIMGKSLMMMRDDLQKASEEDKRRTWAAEGFAKFADILRNSDSDGQKFMDDLIASLVKYVKANQGAIFILNDNHQDRLFLEMKACYAYERKKFLNKQIDVGEGLLGQAYLEKDVIYLTDIPEEYINITSGLGQGNPKSILIAPLKFDDKVLGIIEIASFNEFEEHVIQFVEKLGESIASSLSVNKRNEETFELLTQSQQQTEMMRAQEEEMRQNMEELQAIQEEMSRKERGYIDQIQELEAKLNTLEATKNESSNEEELRKNIDKLQAIQEKMKKKERTYIDKIQELETKLNTLEAIKNELANMESLKKS